MSKALLKVSYRQVIDSTAEGHFEKNILLFSYEEYKMKSQAYNRDGKYKTFTELKAADGRANSLHYKCGFAIGGLIDSLKKQMPHLQDFYGRGILFETYKFEVVESDITDFTSHKIAVHYITETLTLLETFGDKLLLSYGDRNKQLSESIEDAFILALKPNISIGSYSLSLNNASI
jgi:hypothetical protein